MGKRQARVILRTWFQLVKNKEVCLEDTAERLLEVRKPAKVPYKLRSTNYIQHRPRGFSYN